MNRDAILRSFNNAELKVLDRAMKAVVANKRLKADEQAMYDKWYDLGGLAAFQRFKAGLEPKRPTTMDELLDFFNDAEMALLREAMVAIGEKQDMTPEQEEEYARYLILGGELAKLSHREEDERRIIKKYSSQVLLRTSRQRQRARVA